MHVELLRNELCSTTSLIYIDRVMLNALAYADQFKVYIQALISQAMDPNFLTDVMKNQGNSELEIKFNTTTMTILMFFLKKIQF